MKTEVKLITPAIAEEMLKKNTMNRPLDENRVKEYSRQMSAGLWKEETGESIKIASDGTLLDGQKRLTALVRSNIDLKFSVTTGLDKDIFVVLDTGTARTAAHVLSIAGVENYVAVSSGIRKYLRLKFGLDSLVSSYKAPSNQEILRIYDSDKNKWQKGYNMAASWYIQSSRILSSSDFLAYFIFFKDINGDDAFRFMSDLGEGTNLLPTDPVRLLREKLLFAKLNPKFGMYSRTKTHLIIKTWNHFRNGNSIKILKYDPEREGYPVAI